MPAGAEEMVCVRSNSPSSTPEPPASPVAIRLQSSLALAVPPAEPSSRHTALRSGSVRPFRLMGRVPSPDAVAICVPFTKSVVCSTVSVELPRVTPLSV